MGMSTYVQAFIAPTDENYIKHSNVLKACLAADIEELPKETAEYFDNRWPEKELLESKLKVKIPYEEKEENMNHTFEILVSDIPQGTYKIRFTNSY